MGKTIFITEKPSVAQEYKNVLKVTPSGRNDGYVEGHSPVLKKDVIITWAVGHLLGLVSPEVYNEKWKEWSMSNLPLIPDDYKYGAQPSTLNQYKVVKSLYTRNDIDEIYYAGDSGREGIYIQALIRNQIFNKQKNLPNNMLKPNLVEKVVWIDSFTEEAILGGIKSAKPYSSYMGMINSGYARAITDWLIGMNFTRAFSINFGGFGNTINVGRVKCPTLAMIVKRQAEIDAFKKQDFYGVCADKIYWKATDKSRFFESPLLYNENGFIKRTDAEKLLAIFDRDKRLQVEDVKIQTKTEYAPLNFNLADLQSECSKRYKISPAETLAIAQELYEKKFTTYPRTDSRYLTETVAKDYKDRFGYEIPKRYINDKKVTDHYAIIPTFHGNADELTGLTKTVYELILKRFMNIMKPPYIYDVISVVYRHTLSKEPLYESFRKVKQKGFKEGAKEESEKEDGEEEVSDKAIPKKNEIITVEEFTIREMETKPPKPYTTGSLILAMEKAGRLIEDEELREQIKTCGIGTSATRASIIEELARKGTAAKPQKAFINIDKSQVITPTEKGKEVVPLLAKYDEQLISPEKTADLEGRLNSIVEGNLSYDAFMFYIRQYITNTVKAVAAAPREKIHTSSSGSENKALNDKVYKCPHCNKESIKKGKFGWYCAEKCGAMISKVYGIELSDSQIEKLLSGKNASYKSNKGFVNTILPELVENEYNGKVSYVWKVENKKKE